MHSKMYSESNIIALNVSYLKSFPCVLKLIQLLCNLIVTIIMATEGSRIQAAYLIASIGVLVLSSLICLIKIHNIDKYVNNVPWSKVEIGYYTTWWVYYLIVIGQSVTYQPDIVAQIFALFGAITLMIDSTISYTDMQNKKNKKCSCGSILTKEENENYNNTNTRVI